LSSTMMMGGTDVDRAAAILNQLLVRGT